ncbi:hypothetical protein [Sciscionella marina]|uniref:hypothetical protein n=1 Tax=Sciscionella marina TaxID=508770 RepID=UPI00036DD3B7|nr:hypothetical protein [Sciscionella marina]
MNRYVQATVPGSCLIASHGTVEGVGADRVRKVAVGYQGRTNYSAYVGTKEELAAILAPHDLVEPGDHVDGAVAPGGQPGRSRGRRSPRHLRRCRQEVVTR